MALSKSFIQNAAMAPLDARLMNMAGLAADSAGNPRTGVLGNNPSIVTALGTMNVAIAAAEFATSKSKADGVPIFTNNGTTNVAISAAPVSNSRYTIVWVKHEDNTTGDAASLPIFGTTDGAAAASPTLPVIPTGALELAQLRIFSGTTATNGGANTLTNTYRMTAARGGLVHLRSQAEEDGWLPADGSIAYRIDTGKYLARRGGAWRRQGSSDLVAEWHVNVPAGSAGGLPLGPAGASTLVIAAAPYARAIRVTVLGGVLTSSAGDGGVSVVPSAGAWVGASNVHRIQNNGGGTFSDLSYVFYMTTLAAATALTLTMSTQSSVSAGYDLHFIVEEI